MPTTDARVDRDARVDAHGGRALPCAKTAHRAAAILAATATPRPSQVNAHGSRAHSPTIKIALMPSHVHLAESTSMPDRRTRASKSNAPLPPEIDSTPVFVYDTEGQLIEVLPVPPEDWPDMAWKSMRPRTLRQKASAAIAEEESRARGEILITIRCRTRRCATLASVRRREEGGEVRFLLEVRGPAWTVKTREGIVVALVGDRDPGHDSLWFRVLPEPDPRPDLWITCKRGHSQKMDLQKIAQELRRMYPLLR